MKRKFKALGLALGLSAIVSPVISDDIDVFVQPNTLNLTGATGQMMFVLDASASMFGVDVHVVREVLDDFINTVTDIEVGIMRTTEETGAILHPVARVDAPGVWNPADYLVTVGGTPTYQFTASRILNEEDDIREDNSGITVKENIKMESGEKIGLRFANARINPNATISDIYVEFEAGGSSGSPTFTISADCSTNAKRFITLSSAVNLYEQNIDFSKEGDLGATNGYPSEAVASIASRTLTTDTTNCDWDFTGGQRSISWSPAAWSDGNIYRTPNLKDLINVIVSQPDWTYGNDIVLVIESSTSGSRTILDFDESDRDESDADIESARLVMEVAGTEDPANLAGNAKADMRHALSKMIHGGVTPLQGAYWEAYLYWSGLAVDGGKLRDGRKFRVSAPSSVTGTYSHVIPSGCSYDNYNDFDCDGEELTGNPIYNPPAIADTGSACSVGARIVMFSDGRPNRHRRDNEIKTLVSGTTGLLGDNPGECLENAGGHTCMHEMAKYLYEELSIATDVIYIPSSSDPVDLSTAKDAYPNVATYGGGVASAVQIDGSFKDAIYNSYSLATNATPILIPPPVTAEAYGSFTDSDSLYYSLFEPSSEDRAWSGNLKKFKLKDLQIVGLNSGAVETNALDSDGTFSATVRDFWADTGAEDYSEVTIGGVADNVPNHDARNVYFFDESVGTVTNQATSLSALSNKLNVTNVTKAQFDVASYTDAEFISHINWVLGLDTDSTQRNVIGGIIHSSAVVFPYGASNASTRTVYVTTNGGALHAFDEVTGDERWAFMPSSMFPIQKDIKENTALSNGAIYGLDGKITPLLIDNNNNQAVDASGDRAFLFFGMRRGGDNYYGIEVTGKGASGDLDTPTLRWFIDGGTGTTAFAEMGQSWAKPVNVNIKLNGVAYQALILSGGYDAGNDDETLTRATDTIGRAIYIVDALTGTLLWSGGYSSSAVASTFSEQYTDMKYSIPAEVKAINTDADGYVDQFYVGDMGGQIWRFDVNNNNSGAGNLIDAGVIADFGSSADTNNNRRFYRTPTVFVDIDSDKDRYIGIGIGSGYVANPLEKTTNDRFYFIKQYDVYEKPSSYVKLAESNLFNATTSSTPAAGTPTSNLKNNGWYITLGAGEKVLSKPTAFGSLLFTTYEPPSSLVNSASCESNLGINRLYDLEIANGAAVNDDGDNATTDDRFRIIDALLTELSIFWTGSEYAIVTGGYKDTNSDSRATTGNGTDQLRAAIDKDGPQPGLRKSYWFEKQ